MNAVVVKKFAAALIAIVLFGLAGCAGGPPQINYGSAGGYGTGVMPTDTPWNSG